MQYRLTIWLFLSELCNSFPGSPCYGQTFSVSSEFSNISKSQIFILKLSVYLKLVFGTM